MLDNKFLDKVCDQILSETIIDDKGLTHTPFTSSFSFFSSSSLFLVVPIFPSTLFLSSLSKHCKEVYSLNKEETEYVWAKYKEGITTLMDKKELSYE